MEPMEEVITQLKEIAPTIETFPNGWERKYKHMDTKWIRDIIEMLCSRYHITAADMGSFCDVRPQIIQDLLDEKISLDDLNIRDMVSITARLGLQDILKATPREDNEDDLYCMDQE